ncbi:putative reverse transcriptase domain-containing protein [Tanacetum coccineum]
MGINKKQLSTIEAKVWSDHQYLALPGRKRRFHQHTAMLRKKGLGAEWTRDAWDTFSIICDLRPRDSHSNFWSHFNALGTNLDMSTAYHPQTDGQSERTIQTLRGYAACLCNRLWKGTLWTRKCRSLLLTEDGEAQILGPELIQETTEKIIQIKQRMQAARDRQKSYADLKRKPMEFQVGDKVMLLRTLHWKGSYIWQREVNPRYVGPCQGDRKGWRRLHTSLNFQKN